jgi:hypothetical protein
MSRVLAAVLAMTISAACGSHDRPVVRPGQTITVGDTTFRTHEGDRIEVSIVRTFHDQHATGVAMLHGVSLEAAQRSPLVRVAIARAWLSIAQTLATEPAAAYEAARRGIDELRTEYRKAGIIDDTGQWIRLAEMAANADDIGTAASQLIKALRERVDLYLHVFHDSVR